MTDDVAFAFALPLLTDIGANVPTPLILNGSIYALRFGTTTTGEGRVIVNQVDLADGATRTVADYVETIPYAPHHIASDGDRLFVVGRQVTAIPIRGGAPLWATDHQFAPKPEIYNPPQCAPPAIRDGVLYIGCVQPGFGFFDAVTTLQAIRTTDGIRLWTWVEHPNPDPQPSPRWALNAALLGSPQGATALRVATAVSAVGDDVFLATADAPVFNGEQLVAGGSTAVWGVDVASGQNWYARGEWWANVLSEQMTSAGNRANIAPAPTGTSDHFFLKVYNSVERSDRQFYSSGFGPSSDRAAGIRRGGTYEGDPGIGFALTGDALYAASRDTLYRLSHDLEVVWSFVLPPETSFVAGGFVVADGMVFGRTVESANQRSRILAVEERSGTLAFEIPVAPESAFSISDGVLAVQGRDGLLSVFGRTPASIAAAASASTPFPDPGALVSVDMSGTAAGALGPATEFSADWGDGTVTEWQDSPVLSHRYSQPQDYEARFFARNANQTASVFQRFSVGGAPAEELNLLQTAFAPQNQNTTWGLLGLVVAGAGAIIAVARSSRKRTRFQNELAALERLYAETKDSPREGEAMLVERRAHFRGLLVDGMLDESQVALLMARVDELHKGLRLGVVDHRLAFLPLGMVEHLRSILADNQVTAWEHKHFIDALERDDLLSADQKEKVRRLVDDWFARDSAASGGAR
ncbi:MAG: hypothetical protein ACT4PT_05515 [Methanobacteriota archaeon]